MSHELELAGQTLVVIGGSSGIGLETARRAGDEGADLIITARNADRLHRVGLELGASIAAFDATNFDRLGRFFDELPTPIDHVLVTGPGSCYAHLAEFNFEDARRDVEAQILLPLQVARNAASKVRPGGTLLFLGGTGGHRPAVGRSFISGLTAALQASDEEPRSRDRTRPGEPDHCGVRRHAAVGGDPRRPARRAARTAPNDTADPTCRRPGRCCRTRRTPHEQHGGHRRDVRDRRRPTTRPSLTHARMNDRASPRLSLVLGGTERDAERRRAPGPNYAAGTAARSGVFSAEGLRM